MQTPEPAEIADHQVATLAKYIGRLRCEAAHLDSGTTVTSAAPADNQGDGSSFSPTDYFTNALGTCMLTTMAIVGERNGLNLVGAEVTVVKQMTARPPRRIGRITCDFRFPASLTDAQIERLWAAGAACPVKRSLHPEIEVVLRWERQQG